MTNDALLSKTISFLRFPLTVGVVFIHFNLSEGLTIHGAKFGADNPDWYFYFINFFSEVLGSICVPLFFMISGFLFFYRKEFSGEVYMEKLKSRAKTLLTPYLLWNTIAIVWTLKRLLPYLSSYFYQPMEIRISLMRILNTYFYSVHNNGIFVGPTFDVSGAYPIDGPLWYVRELMLMVILSPVIFWLIKRTNGWFVAIAGIVWYFSPVTIPEDNYFHWFLKALFFFSWGAFYSIGKRSIILEFRKYKFLPVIYIMVAIADTLTKAMDYNSFILYAGIILGVVSFVTVASYLLETGRVRVNDTLANSSFFIFALHQMFIIDVGKLAITALHIDEHNYPALLSLYFLVPIGSVAFCLGLYMFLKRFTPKVCNLLTGGR